MAKSKKPKSVSYTLLTRESHREIYARLDALVETFHEELINARIALAWCTSWKPDVDGKQTLGKCKKASELDRELAPYDFVILLLESFWANEAVDNQQRDALLDHELCHATVKLDKFGEPALDAHGREIYRLRKHDLEEFVCIADRYGTWKRDLELFAQALRRSKAQARLPMEPNEGAAPARTH
jgi:hypothetical protein